MSAYRSRLISSLLLHQFVPWHKYGTRLALEDLTPKVYTQTLAVWLVPWTLTVISLITITQCWHQSHQCNIRWKINMPYTAFLSIQRFYYYDSSRLSYIFISRSHRLKTRKANRFYIGLPSIQCYVLIWQLQSFINIFRNDWLKKLSTFSQISLIWWRILATKDSIKMGSRTENRNPWYNDFGGMSIYPRPWPWGCV